MFKIIITTFFFYLFPYLVMQKSLIFLTNLQIKNMQSVSVKETNLTILINFPTPLHLEKNLIQQMKTSSYF